MSSLVSIIIPSFNRKTLIEETMESVRTQSYEELEMIVVDDGSTDGTSHVVKSWIEKHGKKRARLIVLQKNAGKSSAVNRGIKESGGTYIAVLDSDDLLEQEAVEKQVDFLERHPECGMVFGPARIIGKDGVEIAIEGTWGLNRETHDLVGACGDLHSRVNSIVSSSVLMRRSILERVGGLDVGLRFTHDWDLWIRIADASRIGFLPTPVVRYRLDSPGSSSANRIGTFKEIVALLDRYPARGRLVSLLRHARFYAAQCFRDGRSREGLSILGQAFRNAWRMIGS